MFRLFKRGGGLQAKMTTGVLVPTAIILAAVGALAFYASQQVTADLVLERNRDRTQLLANQLSAELEAYQRPLGSLAGQGAGLPIEQLQLVLDREWPGGTLSAFDAGVVVLNGEGHVIAAVPDGRVFREEQFPDSILEQAMSWPEQLPLTDILFDTIGSSDVIAFSYPLVDADGGSQGTAVGLFHAQRGATRTSSFYRRIWELYIGRQDTAYLVDGNGRVIFHPDTFFIGEDFSDLESVEAVLAQETDAVRTEDIEGREVAAGFTPVPRTSWGLITEERWSDVTSALRPYNRFLVALLALGVVVPVTVVALGMRRITRPLAELTRAAQELAGGNFAQTIGVQTGDELETLAQQFNAMAGELQASYASLEQRVERRTRELTTVNAVAAVVSRSLELRSVMGAALEKTLETMEIDAGAAFRLSDEGTLRLMAHQGLSDGFVCHVREMPLTSSIASQAVGEAAPVVRSVDEYPDGPVKMLLQKERFQSVISVPLVARDETLGVLNLAARATRTITPEERSLLAAVGQQAGVAVENARLYEQAEASAALAERNRLARELHDAVSQTLFSASMIADVLPRLWARDPEEGERRLADLRRLTRGAMAEMRTLLWELRPAALLETNLDDLLGQLGRAASGRADLEVSIDAGPVDWLPADVKVALYRIAQEALNNVVKHAGASRVVMSLHIDKSGIELSIRDDGRGFARHEVPPGHLGLSTMAERAESIGAQFTLKSRPGQGTEVVIAWQQE